MRHVFVERMLGRDGRACACGRGRVYEGVDVDVDVNMVQGVVLVLYQPQSYPWRRAVWWGRRMPGGSQSKAQTVGTQNRTGRGWQQGEQVIIDQCTAVV